MRNFPNDCFLLFKLSSCYGNSFISCICFMKAFNKVKINMHIWLKENKKFNCIKKSSKTCVKFLSIFNEPNIAIIE